MGAFMFFLAVFLGGYGLAGRIKIIDKKENQIWGRLALMFGVGYLLYGWAAYIASYISYLYFDNAEPKAIGNLVAMIFMLLIFGVTMLIELKNYTGNAAAERLIGLNPFEAVEDKRRFKKERFWFLLLFAGILASMFYVFYVKDGALYAGASVFSDYSPHTAMIRSFSYHDNFPTQYPHYGGEDVKYHFMFQFLAGNLEWLGLRIDWAYNILAATSLWSFLVLLYFFAKRITKCAAGGVLTVFMFFCRSSFAVWKKLAASVASGQLAESFLGNAEFIGNTAHENWGLWNYNVFLNQRHLGFALIIGIAVIMYFYEKLNWADGLNGSSFKGKTFGELSRRKRAAAEFRQMFLRKESWLPKNICIPLLLGILLGALAFWNGAVVIATLLILFGFAIFSQRKLEYLITAVIAVVLTLLQTNFFIDSSVGQNIGVSFYFGFLADNTTVLGVIQYLLKLAGIYFIGIFAMFFISNKKNKFTLFAFLLPVIFAFTISMTPDITVNHKYIIIACIFLNILWADVLIRLWRIRIKRNAVLELTAKAAAVMLTVLLTATGAYELLIIYNQDKSAVSVDLSSNLTRWLKKNTTEDDLILTGQDSMSEITLSGCMMYCGWPYYAWSAGYDTDERAVKAKAIYTSTDETEVSSLVDEEGITYIVYEDEMTYEDVECTDAVISELYECVYDDGNTQIYEIS